MHNPADREPIWVRVIIVNYNGGTYIQPCLDALAGQSMRAFEAIVVDNASTDGSAECLSLPDERFRLIRNADNIGFAGANNAGARDCVCDFIATLNPDTIPDVDWLLEMRRGIGRHPGAAAYGATLLAADDCRTVDGFGDVLSISGVAWRGGYGRSVAELPREDREVLAPCAAAALYRRSAFEAVAGFDEAFFCYLEDVDIGLRLRLIGERCIQLRHAAVLHYGSGITGKKRPFTIFYSTRNRIFLLYKTLPWPLLPIGLSANLLASALLCVTTSERGYGQAVRQGMLAGWKGTRHLREKRRQIQSRRRISIAALARLLSWSPRDIARTRVKAWPVLI